MQDSTNKKKNTNNDQKLHVSLLWQIISNIKIIINISNMFLF